MDLAYENAVCTIAAHTALNSHDGCYATRDPLLFTPCKIAGTPDDSLFGSLDLKPELSTLRSSKLSSRGWRLQETLLSSRILHFARTGIYLTCLKGRETEIDLQGGNFFSGHWCERKTYFWSFCIHLEWGKGSHTQQPFYGIRGSKRRNPEG
jgi:hypothetical protein